MSSTPTKLIKGAGLVVCISGLVLGAPVVLARAAPAHRAQNARHHARGLAYDESVLKTGDVLFRRGRSLTSRALLLADGRAAFSHVGLVIRQRDTVWVVHAVPQDGATVGGVRRDPLSRFLARENAVDAALYRLRAKTGTGRDGVSRTSERAARASLDYVARDVPFDEAFDLASDSAVYCTELVWRAYQSVGLDLTAGRRDTISMGHFLRIGILTSTLEASPSLERTAFLRLTPNP